MNRQKLVILHCSGYQLKTKVMKLIYIFHSCFAIESETFTILIDYYKDAWEGNAANIVHNDIINRPGKLYVLSTHSHPDHFNAEVLKWNKGKKDIRYIFSRDILTTGKAKQDDAVYLNKFDVYEDSCLRVQAFGSTDIGVSFLIEAEGKKIFHAGDLNNWHWKDESTPEESQVYEANYLKELNELASTTDVLDVALFPIDPRLGKEYMLGAKQLVDKMHVSLFVPMHFMKAYDKANAFKKYANSKGTRFFEITRQGESIEF